MKSYFDKTPQEEWTITGLALALNTSRETLLNYQERPEFFGAIKKGKDMVHAAYELDLRRKGRSGDIFALKNFGWSDKTETELTGQGGGPIEQSITIKFQDGSNTPNSVPVPLPTEPL